MSSCLMSYSAKTIPYLFYPLSFLNCFSTFQYVLRWAESSYSENSGPDRTDAESQSNLVLSYGILGDVSNLFGDYYPHDSGIFAEEK